MFTWGSYKITDLSPASFLPPLLRVLESKHSAVANEVLLSVTRLVKKYGKGLTYSWAVIFEIFSKMAKLPGFSNEKYALQKNLTELLGYILGKEKKLSIFESEFWLQNF